MTIPIQAELRKPVSAISPQSSPTPTSAMDTSTALPQGYANDTSTEKGEPASASNVAQDQPRDRDHEIFHWSGFGFDVITKVAADKQDLAFKVGESLIVVVAKGKVAQAALLKIEKSCNRWPTMIVTGPSGVEHYFWLGKNSHVPPEVKVLKKHDGHIDIMTGRATVVLPPYGEKVLTLNQASGTGDFPTVGQDFVDAILESNRSPSVVPETVEVAPAAGSVTPAAAVAPPDAMPKKGGKGGEGGAPTAAGSSTAPFTAFTASGGQSPRENSSEVPSPAPAPAAAAPQISATEPIEAGKGGEGGVLQTQAQKVGAGAFMVLQAAALVAIPTKGNIEPAIRYAGSNADDVLTPKAAANPVIVALEAQGLYKTPLGSGSHEIACPWAHEHTDGFDKSATYFEPDDLNSTGGFHCQYAHHITYATKDLLEHLGVPKTDARHKSVIRVVPGDLHRVIDAAEFELAKRGRHFQAGGMIVSISTDPATGNPSIVPTRTQALTRELSVAATWEKQVGHSDEWVPCDPPSRHVGLLCEAQAYPHLPPLAGLARQPYFREVDGVLVTQPGYDKASKRFGVFDPQQYVMPSPTRETAMAALAMLEELISEFRFAQESDKSAALSAMFTATVRPSLPQAPGYHATSAVYGSGKSHLCEVIVAFTGPAPSEKVSFPSTSEEATKMIMSLLIKSPAVVEFDDMATDLIPHGIINRMLTAEWLTDRVLGFSKTATVSTRTLFLSSGNNVGPLRDLLRRVIAVNLDPRCETPALISYKGKPVETIRKHRGAYVAAVLTIIQAWRNAGSPRTDVSSIATYGGAWADHCRHPLIWLGLPDPATTLLDQVAHDPDSEALGALLTAWNKAFGTRPTTVRKAIELTNRGGDALKEALAEFPIMERGEINPSRLGWLLKKNANRIVAGLKFERAEGDGRTAWRVVVSSPALRALPPQQGNTPAQPDDDPLGLY